jgi:hypothetical protein
MRLRRALLLQLGLLAVALTTTRPAFAQDSGPSSRRPVLIALVDSFPHSSVKHGAEAIIRRQSTSDLILVLRKAASPALLALATRTLANGGGDFRAADVPVRTQSDQPAPSRANGGIDVVFRALLAAPTRHVEGIGVVQALDFAVQRRKHK